MSSAPPPDPSVAPAARPEPLPYSRPCVTDEDVAAVAAALASPMISQGAELAAFERDFAAFVGARHAVGLSSGTAAIHAALAALGIGPGDEVVLPALTFAGTANAARYLGARPVFADVDPATRCLAPGAAERALTGRTRAILTVDFAGHPSAYAPLRALADRHGLALVSDAAHAPGASYRGRRVGSDLADLTAFSFNPIKNLTAGEGGMVTTDDDALAARVARFRVHGMTRDPAALERPAPAGWYYEQQALGYNYKLSELHAALGRSQLRRLPDYNARRAALAARYDDALGDLPLDRPPRTEGHAWHLYAVTLHAGHDRDAVFERLRAEGIGVQLHYLPVPAHPDYVRHGYTLDGLDATVDYAARAFSLPLYPWLEDAQQDRVVATLRAILTRP